LCYSTIGNGIGLRFDFLQRILINKDEKNMLRYITTNGGNVNIRSGAGTQHAVIGTLKNGESYPLLSAGIAWHEIQFGRGTAFVSAKHTKVITPEQSVKTTIQPNTENIVFPVTYHQTTKFTSGKNECRGVAFHHTAGSVRSAVNVILNSGKFAGYHCIIDTDGSQHRFNNDEAILWHAGESLFKNRTNCNRFLLGVAFSGDTSQRTLTAAEIQSALSWLEERWDKYNWTMDWMTTHRAIAPRRKVDISASAEQQLFAAIREKFTIGKK
jgi:uncharacterized protein YraI